MMIGHTRNGDVEIAYEKLGDPQGEPLLLVMGTGGQMLSWPDGFCELLTERGFQIARFDNRDSGLSTHLDGAGRPNQLTMLLRPAAAAVYRLEDMAGDAVAVLDALGWPSAHVAGMSQGGMIAQSLAVRHPDRVRSLTSISSSPAPRLGQPRPGTLLRVLQVANPRRVRSAEDLAQYLVDLRQVTGSPGYPADEEWLRGLGRRSYDRGGLDTAAVQRQTAAIAASGDRREELRQVRVPTLVLHGEDDRMIRPVAGRATAGAIPGARLATYAGMGHELPRPLWPAIAGEIAALARRAAPAVS
jgi:pimeloyl-ACP methyl ester carboxylesterase